MNEVFPNYPFWQELNVHSEVWDLIEQNHYVVD